MSRTNGNRPRRIRRDLLALVPRVNVHPEHAVVDGVTYPGGLAEYRAKVAAQREKTARDLTGGFEYDGLPLDQAAVAFAKLEAAFPELLTDFTAPTTL